MESFDIIDINNLSKSYKDLLALDHVNLTLSTNKIIGLLGPNGAGKTTLIKVLTGLLNDYEGSVLINGKEVGKESKAIVSYLPDATYLYSWMKVSDALSLFDDMYDDFSYSECEQLLKDLNVDLKAKIKNLSKGNQEKVQLALVMSRDAMIYILDEPIAGVDPATREKILEIITSHRRADSLVLLSTHLITDIEEVFDEIIFLKDGRVELFDSRDNLVNEHKKSINKLFIEVYR